jgi:hypothetical protein
MKVMAKFFQNNVAHPPWSLQHCHFNMSLGRRIRVSGKWGLLSWKHQQNQSGKLKLDEFPLSKKDYVQGCSHI